MTRVTQPGGCRAEIQTLLSFYPLMSFSFHSSKTGSQSLLEALTQGCVWAQREVPPFLPNLSKLIHFQGPWSPMESPASWQRREVAMCLVASRGRPLP